ncbi:hypothetical protein QO207_18120 [Pseudomonas sp. CAN2814]|uniref:hypothetical protein n=1 Tax=Pseudomonas sp. CAN1 TaxID=3046726 RepID=UPI002647B8E2|nr:hypothetical protein [Pseudomonas sp. CAN1]MDN6858512.1 hypothetical protein [Pseudomonas sp. CAN1]
MDMNAWLRKLLGRPSEAIETNPILLQEHARRAWPADQQSLYGYLSHYVDYPDGLPDDATTLPDEVPAAEGELSWSAGALDGVVGHHGNAGQSDEVDQLLGKLRAACDSPNSLAPHTLYEHLCRASPLEYLDPLIERLPDYPGISREKLEPLALWLATEAPDRAPVKFAMAMLGVLGNRAHVDILTTLGLHEEFTLYAAVALGNLLDPEEAEQKQWQLARKVHAWGRIHLVERLAQTRDMQIRDWLLREGYRNGVMYEYLAYSCAVGGQLAAALSVPAVALDDDLLNCAAEILSALLCGGPARDIRDYADGAWACDSYLLQVRNRRSGSLQSLQTTGQILEFLQGDEDWDSLAQSGWTPQARELLAARAKTFIDNPVWPETALAALQESDRQQVWQGISAARLLDLDIWEPLFLRQAEGRGEHWYQLMQTRDIERLRRVLDLARQQLDLAAIASGPGETLGLGPAYQQHNDLDFILQDLEHFPGEGWDLIRAGLNSPTVRNRNMALKAISAWPRETWPEDALSTLRKCRQADPNEGVRQRCETLLQDQH